MYHWPKCGCSERCSKLKCIQAGGRELLKEAVHVVLTEKKKNSPQRMKALLDRIQMFPGVVNACLFVGVTYNTLRYWVKKSQAGQPGDGFDLTYGEEHKRFHEHFDDCLQTAVQMVEDAYQDRALHGYYETLHHQGRVAYQYDQGLLDLGLSGAEAFLRDEKGKPIPERIQHQDPEVMLAVLKAWRRDRYGQKDQLDVLHRGGVMVITAPARSSAELEQRAQRVMSEPIDVEFIEAPEPDAPKAPEPTPIPEATDDSDFLGDA